MIIARSVVAALAALIVGAGCFGPAASPALSQSYPSRVIKLVVPFTPGSPNDVMARLLTQHLQPRLGQAFVVENKPGGGTTIGTKAVAMAEPDGHTLLFVSSALVIDPALHKKLDYDPRKDFVPIASVTTTSWLLAIHPSLPARTVAEFVAYTKARPGTVSFGFAQGTASQFVGERFKVLSGADFLSVPYRGGAAALPDFLGGRLQMLLPTPSTTLPLIREGKLRALAITSAERSPDLPDVPTMNELNMPSLTLDFWAGVLAPAGTPPETVAKLNAAINDALRSPEMKDSMKRLGFEAKIGTPQDFSTFIADELPRWAEIVRSSGVKID